MLGLISRWYTRRGSMKRSLYTGLHLFHDNRRGGDWVQYSRPKRGQDKLELDNDSRARLFSFLTTTSSQCQWIQCTLLAYTNLSSRSTPIRNESLAQANDRRQ